MYRFIFLVLSFGLLNVLQAGPAFTQSPLAVDQGGQIVVTFAVSEYTDVTVEVLDSIGGTVRHLASGKLGANPPAPLAANSLSQSLAWDKNDDKGRPFTGAYDIKVGLGLTADFDRIFGSPSSNLGGYLRGAAVDTSGNVYLIYGGYIGESKVFLCTRSGEYLRTLTPYPSSLPEERVKGYGRVTLTDGRKVPRIYTPQYKFQVQPGLMGQQRQGACVTPQGNLVFMNGGSALHGTQMRERRVMVMGFDGSCPLDTFFGPRVSPGINDVAYHLAVSPDNRTVYSAGNGPNVYRAPVQSLDSVRTFITGLVAPHGLETDAAGRIYVCDWLADRVKIFDSTGAPLDSFDVRRPEMVKVNRRNNQIYVFSMDTALAYVKVIKYGALPACDSVCSVTFSWPFKQRAPIFALDYAATHPIAWVGPLEYGKDLLNGAQDTGSAFVRMTQTVPNSAQRYEWSSSGGASPGYLAVDPGEKFLYAGNRSFTRVDLETGALASSRIKGVELTFSPDGNSIYAVGAGSYTDTTILRYDRNETRIAFGNGSLSWGGPAQYCWGPDVGSRGMVQTENGDFYVFHSGPNARGPFFTPITQNRVSVYDSLCILRDSMIIDAPTSSGGIQVDRAGGIYISYNCHPKGMGYPGLLQDFSMDFAGLAYANYYDFGIGSLFKFPPAGGSIRGSATAMASVPDGNLNGNTVPPVQICGMRNHVLDVSGATWQYYGISMSPSSENWGDPSCCCVTPRFSVDEYGRTFLPDAYTFSIVVLDGNRNEILRFGEYGNADQTGPGSAVASPDIPLTCPEYVAKVNQSVYVSDYGSRRVLRAKLAYQSWATVNGQSSAEFRPLAAPVLSISVWPNPFTPGVNLEIKAPPSGRTSAAIYSADGRLVKKLDRTRGTSHVLYWDGRNDSGRPVAAGVYVARARAAGIVVEKKLLLVR